MKKKIKLIISVCAAVLCVVIGIVIYNNLPSVVMNKRIDAFNKLCAFYETYGPQDQFYENGYSDYVYGQHTKLVDRCGLGSGYLEYAEYIMGNDFVDAYIEQYSAEEFVEKLFYIYTNIDEKCYDYGSEYCNARTTNSVLLYALKCAQIDVQPFELPEEGTEGYYTENPNSLPEERTWEESGSFYSSSGENRRTQTRTCSIKVTIHGDFAVEHCDIYHYSEGAYEWRNGEFIDELPSWRHEVYDDFHYKGHWIRDDLSAAELFTVGDTCYVLYAPDDCGYSDKHTSRKWDILG